MAFDDLLDEQKTFIIRLVELFNSGKYKSEFNGGVTFTGRYINIFGKEGENSKKIVGFSKSTLNLLHEEGYLILDSPNANSFSGCLKPKAFSEYQKWEEEIPDREKLARKFEAWLKEFKDDVCTAFERGGESKGKTSFRFWELHFINFLESKLPGYLIAYRECLLSNWSPINSDFSPLQNFMRYDGDAVQLFLEQCITDARKGHLDEFLIKGKEQEKPQIQPQVAPEAQIIESVEESRSGVITPGQVFDAYKVISTIFSRAEKNIIVIDNYIDDKLFIYLSGKSSKVTVKILTTKENISHQTIFAGKLFNEQHGGLEIRFTTEYHDRFVIIDDKDYYSLGASIKDAGKKVSAWHLLEEPESIRILRNQFDASWKKAESKSVRE